MIQVLQISSAVLRRVSIWENSFETVGVFLVMNSVFFAPVYCHIYHVNHFVFLKSTLLFWGTAVNLWQAVTCWLSELEVRRLLTSMSRGFAVWTFYKLRCLTFSLGGLTNLPDSCWVWGSLAVQDHAYIYTWKLGKYIIVKLHAQHWLIVPLLLVMESMTREGLCLLTESTSGCHTAMRSRSLILSWFTPHPVHDCNSSRCATCW